MNTNNLSPKLMVAIMTSAVLLLILAFAWTHQANAASPSSSAESAHFQKMSHGFGPRRLFKLIRHLDLSRAQHEQIGAIMDANRPLMRTFMLDMKDAKKALQKILKDPNYDPAAVEFLAKAQAKNAEKLFLSTAKAFAEVGSVLNAEQRQQLAEKLEKRGRSGHHGWHGKHRRSTESAPSRHDL